MSYLCMLANETGIVLVGDSRVSLQPGRLGVHVSGRKVYAVPEKNMVWGCCGLVAFGGCCFPALARRLLRSPDESLATALRKLGDAAAPRTQWYRRLYRQDGLFLLLVGRMTERGADVRRLRVKNGDVTVERISAPALLEIGWDASRYPERPAPEALAGESLTELRRTAVRRVQQVIALDGQLHEVNPDWPQTVGGYVRCVSAERER